MKWTKAVVMVILAIPLIATSPVAALAQPSGEALRPLVEPEGQDPAEGPCDHAPGLAGGVCAAVGAVVGGELPSIVAGGVDAVFGALVGFVVDGARWLLEGVASFIDSSTEPDVASAWFRNAYRDMSLIAALVVLPLLLLALVQALLRQDARMMVDIVVVRVPLAAIGTSVAVVVVALLIRLTDEMSAWIGRGIGADLSAFATGVGSALASIGAPSGPVVAGLAGLLAGALVAFSAFVIWLELLLRQAAVYVAVLFLPLGFMAMVWPATAHWLRRLLQGLVAIILSKFVIVAVIALAASGIDADVADEGFGVVLAGGSMLALAALAPYVLLKLIPVFDADLSSQLEGTFRRPTAAVATPVTGTQMAGILRQRMASGGGVGGGSPSAAGSSASPATAVGAGAAAAPGLAVTAAGARGAHGAGRAVRDRAERMAGASVPSSAGKPGAVGSLPSAPASGTAIEHRGRP